MIQIDQVIKQISPLLQPLMYVGIAMSLYYDASGMAEAPDSIIKAGSSSERKPELPGPERTPSSLQDLDTPSPAVSPASATPDRKHGWRQTARLSHVSWHTGSDPSPTCQVPRISDTQLPRSLENPRFQLCGPPSYKDTSLGFDFSHLHFQLVYLSVLSPDPTRSGTFPLPAADISDGLTSGMLAAYLEGMTELSFVGGRFLQCGLWHQSPHPGLWATHFEIPLPQMRPTFLFLLVIMILVHDRHNWPLFSGATGHIWWEGQSTHIN